MKQFSLTRTIATVGLLLAAVAIVVFIFLTVDVGEPMGSGDVENPKLITPKTMGSYGELMFAYIGEDNYIYDLDNESEPLIKDRASELLYASDDSVLYIVPCEITYSHIGRESVIRELQVAESGNQLNTIATVTIDPCWSSNDEVIYFVEDDTPTILRTFEPLQSATELAAEFEQEITGLRVSSDGLLVTLADGTESVFVPLSKQLAVPVFDYRGQRITVCEQYDLLLSADGKLDYHWQGADNSVTIANSVIAAISYQDNEIFYIERTGHGTTLNMYVVSDEEHAILAELPDDIMLQLTANTNFAFVIDERGFVYRYDISQQTLIPYHFIKTDEIGQPMISLFDYRLMIYDLAKEPDQSYCYAIPAESNIDDNDVDELNQMLYGLDANVDKAEFPDLTLLGMGSMGDEVIALQEQIVARGYSSAEPSGFYDISTLWAIKEIQNDLGLQETGIADRRLQSVLLAEDATNAPETREITKNSTGVWISTLQAKMRTLGYMASKVSGIIDDNTIEGLKALGTQMGIDTDEDNLAPAIMQIIFSDDVPSNSKCIVLMDSMNAPAVLRLNRRLSELFYLESYPCPEMGAETIRAVQLFCDVNGLSFDPVVSPEIQEIIYSENAMLCPDEMRPDKGTDVRSNTPGQVISDRELKILRKWLTKSFAVNHTDKQAVKRFQKQLVRLGYLTEGAVSMIYDRNTADAVSKYQEDNDLPSNGIADKKTLMAIFGLSNATLSGE